MRAHRLRIGRLRRRAQAEGGKSPPRSVPTSASPQQARRALSLALLSQGTSPVGLPSASRLAASSACERSSRRPPRAAVRHRADTQQTALPSRAQGPGRRDIPAPLQLSHHPPGAERDQRRQQRARRHRAAHPLISTTRRHTRGSELRNGHGASTRRNGSAPVPRMPRATACCAPAAARPHRHGRRPRAGACARA